MFVVLFFFMFIVLQLVSCDISFVIFMSLFIFVEVVSHKIWFGLFEWFVDLLFLCAISDH